MIGSPLGDERLLVFKFFEDSILQALNFYFNLEFSFRIIFSDVHKIDREDTWKDMDAGTFLIQNPSP